MAIRFESQSVVVTPSPLTSPMPSLRMTSPVVETPSPFHALKITRDVSKFIAAFRKTDTERALEGLKTSYADLKASVDLKQFQPQKIQQYFTEAERRLGVPLTIDDQERLLAWAQSGDEPLIRSAALELRVGVPIKAEKAFWESFGRLASGHQNINMIKAMIADPAQDPGLKAYLDNLIWLYRVQGLVKRYRKAQERYKRFKKKLKKAVTLQTYVDWSKEQLSARPSPVPATKPIAG
jgi:hypothetical protein